MNEIFMSRAKMGAASGEIWLNGRRAVWPLLSSSSTVKSRGQWQILEE